MPSTVLGRRHRKHKRSRKRLLSAIAGPAVLVGRQDNTLAVRTWARVSAVKVRWADDGRWGLCTAQGRLASHPREARSCVNSCITHEPWGVETASLCLPSPQPRVRHWPVTLLCVDCWFTGKQVRAESAERHRVASARVCRLLQASGFCSSLALKCPGTRHGPKAPSVQKQKSLLPVSFSATSLRIFQILRGQSAELGVGKSELQYQLSL